MFLGKPQKGPPKQLINTHYYYFCTDINIIKYSVNDSEFVITHLIQGPKARFRPKQIGVAQTTLTYLLF